MINSPYLVTWGKDFGHENGHIQPLECHVQFPWLDMAISRLKRFLENATQNKLTQAKKIRVSTKPVN